MYREGSTARLPISMQNHCDNESMKKVFATTRNYGPKALPWLSLPENPVRGHFAVFELQNSFSEAVIASSLCDAWALPSSSNCVKTGDKEPRTLINPLKIDGECRRQTHDILIRIRIIILLGTSLSGEVNTRHNLHNNNIIRNSLAEATPRPLLMITRMRG